MSDVGKSQFFVDTAQPRRYGVEPAGTGGQSFDVETAAAPLFRDPVYDGAAGSSITWHREAEEWWLVCDRDRYPDPDD